MNRNEVVILCNNPANSFKVVCRLYAKKDPGRTTRCKYIQDSFNHSSSDTPPKHSIIRKYFASNFTFLTYTMNFLVMLRFRTPTFCK